MYKYSTTVAGFPEHILASWPQARRADELVVQTETSPQRRRCLFGQALIGPCKEEGALPATGGGGLACPSLALSYGCAFGGEEGGASQGFFALPVGKA